MLYFGTVVTAFGVAVMQPSLPPLVRAWVPQRIGFATAVYTNGLLIGEILPAALTIPLVLPMLRPELAVELSCSGRCRSSIIARDHLRPRAARAGCRPDRRQPALDAGLPQSANLADRPAARQRQRDLFLDERLPAGLSHPHRPARPHQRRADRAQPRPASRLVPAARLGRPDGAHGVVLPGVRLRLPSSRCWRSCCSAAPGSWSAARCGAASAPRSWCWCWRCRR